jgi:putative transposase
VAKRNQDSEKGTLMTENTPSPLGNVISIDDGRIKNHLDRVVRGTVEETLNALLGAEADRLCNARRYERSEARRDTRAGHYARNLQTKAGAVRLKVPKLRQQTFETAISISSDRRFRRSLKMRFESQFCRMNA